MELRPIQDRDVETVSDFLRAPHVARWWHDDPDIEAVREKYRDNIAGTDPTTVLIVVHDRQSIGLAQWYRWDDYPQGRDEYGVASGTLGIDYLLGHAKDCDKGLGTQLIATLLEALPAGDVWVTPEAENEPSRRVLEKNGFELMAVKQCTIPDEQWAGPTALYRKARPAAGLEQ